MNAIVLAPEQNGLTLILGGTRSGKSAYAEKKIAACEKQLHPHEPQGVLYVATAESRPDDPAMLDRIRRHQERRPAHWETLECPLHLAERLSGKLLDAQGQPLPTAPGIIMIDCVTLWVSNILFSLPNPEDMCAFENGIEAELTALTELAARSDCHWVLVSGETGLGLVAPTALGRNYCDGLGLANQLLASSAREVILVLAGRALSLPAPIY